MALYASRPNHFLSVVLLGTVLLFAQISVAEHVYEHDPLEIDSYCQICLHANSTNDQLISNENTRITPTDCARSTVAFVSQVHRPKFRSTFARAPPF